MPAVTSAGMGAAKSHKKTPPRWVWVAMIGVAALVLQFPVADFRVVAAEKFGHGVGEIGPVFFPCADVTFHNGHAAVVAGDHQCARIRNNRFSVAG